jgi:hypothetical protein
MLVLAKQACDFVLVKCGMTRAEILEHLRGKATDQNADWTTVDPDWFKDAVSMR